ncbi:MAG: hypothetical protein WC612_01035 [Bdellovibrionales bacterium]|jgi:hypothetical protein
MQQQKKKKESEWPSLVFGIIFIVSGVLLVAYIVANAKPEKPWICDTAGRTKSLTQFGSCHK